MKFFFRKEVAPELADNFDYFTYFNTLKTKSLGKVLLRVPVCNSTIDISNRLFFLFYKIIKIVFSNFSLSNAFPQVDGILVSTGCQLRGRGKVFFFGFFF